MIGSFTHDTYRQLHQHTDTYIHDHTCVSAYCVYIYMRHCALDDPIEYHWITSGVQHVQPQTWDSTLFLFRSMLRVFSNDFNDFPWCSQPHLWEEYDLRMPSGITKRCRRDVPSIWSPVLNRDLESWAAHGRDLVSRIGGVYPNLSRLLDSYSMLLL
jgi:hypothetical protein